MTSTSHRSHLDTIAVVTVSPAVEGPDHGAVVRRAVAAMRHDDLLVEPGAMGTTVQGDLVAVLDAVQRAHRSAVAVAERVVTSVQLETAPAHVEPEHRRAEAQDALDSGDRMDQPQRDLHADTPPTPHQTMPGGTPT